MHGGEDFCLLERLDSFRSYFLLLLLASERDVHRSDFVAIYMYISYKVHATHFSSTGLMLRNVGGVDTEFFVNFEAIYH